MAEQSKFAGALGRLNKRPIAGNTVQRKQAPAAATPLIPPPEPTSKGRGGKRSDPEYSPTTFFVRKQTKRRAAQLLLEDENSDKDLSDLVEQLLAKWVSEHSHL
jgi:hypothetical protein